MKVYALFLLLTLTVSAQQLTFQKATYPAGNGTASLISADFNGDGKPDIAVIDAVSNVFSVLLNKGDGTFGDAIPYAAPNCTPFFLAAGDFVKDSKPDILVVCASSSTFYIFPGRGDGTFLPPISTNAPAGVLAFFDEINLGIGDFNNDGFLDIAYMSYIVNSNSLTGNLNIYLGNGAGQFIGPRPVGNIQGVSVTAADVNHDGNLDLIVSQPPGFSAAFLVGVQGKPGTVQVLPGKGDGTFTTGASYAMTFSPGPVTVGDLNGDNNPDLIVNGYYDSMAVLTGNGNGTFKLATSQSVGGTGTAGKPVLVDLAGTGTPGILIPTALCCAGQLLYFPVNKDGTLQPYIPIQTGINSPSAIVADFNNDKRMDIALASFPIDLTTISQIYSNHNASLAVNSLVATLINTTSATPAVSHVNAAGFQPGATLAAGSIASAFGSGGLAAATDTPGVLPLPTSDQGASVTVKDSTGTARLAPLFFVSAKQINYQIPDATAPGAATITIASPGQSFSTPQAIAAVAPGIFQANPATHLISADVLNVHQDGSRTTGSAATLDGAGTVVPQPIDLGLTNDQIFLTIYATGIKNAKTVTATLGSTPIPVPFTGPQGTFVGLDQINIGPLPQSLRGAGQSTLAITADGIAANPVILTVK